MPIAGASTAWTQNANGNIALSLGLVLFTTALSPLFTPLIFHATGLMTLGDYSEDLHELASGNVVSFLNIWVVLPSIAGLITRLVIPTSLLDNSKPYLKLANYVILILLNYANSALTLPNAIHNPDFDFLFIIVFIVTLLCILTFYSGYYLGHILNVTRKDILSLMFGLGMNNNGTALVLASMTLTDHTEVMLPIIFYNLVQHIIASLVDSKRLFIRAVY
jgi:BASS family bile acid:Na+ symporter